MSIIDEIAVVAKVLQENIKDLAAGRMGYSTAEVGDLIIEHIETNV